jgi:hypothetical protein
VATTMVDVTTDVERCIFNCEDLTFPEGAFFYWDELLFDDYILPPRIRVEDGTKVFCDLNNKTYWLSFLSQFEMSPYNIAIRNALHTFAMYEAEREFQKIFIEA